VAWINEPFHLDFKRNPIYDVDTAGMLTSWARVPPAKYVLWEYRGNGVEMRADYEHATKSPGAQVQMIGHRALSFGRDLSSVVSRGQRIYDDGRTAVFLLPEPIQRDLKPSPKLTTAPTTTYVITK
jgi:hypothetical protein